MNKFPTNIKVNKCSSLSCQTITDTTNCVRVHCNYANLLHRLTDCFICQTATDVALKILDFGGIENVISIHDDLIIAFDDFESHVKHSLMFFKRPDQEIINYIDTKNNTVSGLIR